MCGIATINGEDVIKFKDGTVIPISKLQLEYLTAEQLREIEEMKLLNELAVRKRLHEHSNILQRILNKLQQLEEKIMTKADVDKRIEEKCENHFKNDEIRDFLETEWTRIFKKKVLSFSSLLQAVTVIILSFLGLSFVANLIKKILGV